MKKYTIIIMGKIIKRSCTVDVILKYSILNLGGSVLNSPSSARCSTQTKHAHTDVLEAFSLVAEVSSFQNDSRECHVRVGLVGQRQKDVAT